MAITTIDEAQHEVQVCIDEAQADNPDIEIDASDAVAAVCWSIEDDDLARELCRVELGWIPRELEPRLGRKDWIES